MRIGIVTILILSAIALYAQDADVVALRTEDAEKVQKLYADLNRIQEQLDEAKERIREQYLQAGPDEASDCTGKMRFKKGWGCGDFLFSKDFKYIVPKQRETPVKFSPWTIVPAGGSFSSLDDPSEKK